MFLPQFLELRAASPRRPTLLDHDLPNLLDQDLRGLLYHVVGTVQYHFLKRLIRSACISQRIVSLARGTCKSQLIHVAHIMRTQERCVATWKRIEKDLVQPFSRPVDLINVRHVVFLSFWMLGKMKLALAEAISFQRHTRRYRYEPKSAPAYHTEALQTMHALMQMVGK